MSSSELASVLSPFVVPLVAAVILQVVLYGLLRLLLGLNKPLSQRVSGWITMLVGLPIAGILAALGHVDTAVAYAVVAVLAFGLSLFGTRDCGHSL